MVPFLKNTKEIFHIRLSEKIQAQKKQSFNYLQLYYLQDGSHGAEIRAQSHFTGVIPSVLTCQSEPRTISDEAMDRFMIKESFEIRQQRGGLTQKFQGTWFPK